MYGPFHRLQSPTQSNAVARLQQDSQQVWGRPRRYSDIPQVQAYTGPLPDGAAGVEFYTAVPPDAGTAPGHARWTAAGRRRRKQQQQHPPDENDDEEDNVLVIQDEFAKIRVTISKNTQLVDSGAVEETTSTGANIGRHPGKEEEAEDDEGSLVAA